MEKVSVREFIPEDSLEDKNTLLKSFLDIWNTTENIKYLSVTMRPFRSELVFFWLENHKEKGVHYYCAISENNEIFGISVVKENQIDGFELYGIGVKPGFKRKGIGRKLLEHIVDEAIQLDFKAVDVSVFADNPAMLRLLLSQDFVPVNMDFRQRADGADIVHLKKYL